MLLFAMLQKLRLTERGRRRGRRWSCPGGEYSGSEEETQRLNLPELKETVAIIKSYWLVVDWRSVADGCVLCGGLVVCCAWCVGGSVLWLVVCCGWCVLGLWCAGPEGNGKYIWLSDCNKRQCWAAATGAATQQCWRSDGRPQGALSPKPGSRRTLSQH